MVNSKKIRLRKIKRKGIYALGVDPGKYEETIDVLTSRLTEDFKLFGVYISLNRPSREVIRNLRKNGIKTNRILFLDSTIRKDECNTKTCVRIGDSIVKMSLAVSSAIKKNQVGFILLDSVNALSLYHDEEMVEDFISFFSEKMRYLKIPTVFISVNDNTSKKFNPFLNKVCDSLIKV